MKRHIPSHFAGFVAGLIGVCVISAGVAGDPPIEPPQWIEGGWSDFPVVIPLDSIDELSSLRPMIGATQIAREDIAVDRSNPDAPVFVRIRVTEETFRALRETGYDVMRVRDDVRIGYEAAVETWKAQRAAGGEVWRTGQRDAYHTVEQLHALMDDIETANPTLAETFVIGNSVQGRALKGIRITDNVGVEEAEPEVRISSSIHGDEVVGMELCVYLMEYLIDNYGSDPVVDNLVENYDIHLLPMHNPDGYVAHSRYNAHGYDLNRNYPVPDGSIGQDNTYDWEPETEAMIDNLGHSHDFIIALDYHGGALVVNYPWDYTPVATPDEDALIELSLEYSQYNIPMYNGGWYQGITNGWDWYPTYGSVQDWAYHETGCLHVILEVSNTKWPNASQLDGYWDDNRESLLHWIKAARYGINGVVTDASNGDPVDAVIAVAGNDKSVFTDPAVGDYYKLLDDGTYTVTVSAEGYDPQTINDVSVSWGSSTVIDVALLPEGIDSVDGVPQIPVARLVASPNPFGPKTTISFTLADMEATVDLAIFDAAGRHVRTLLDGARLSGTRTVSWDGTDDRGTAVAGGVYFTRVSAKGAELTRRLTLIR